MALLAIFGITFVALSQTGIRRYKCTTHQNDKFGCINGTLKADCIAIPCETWVWTSPVKFCIPVEADIWCTNNPPTNPGVPYAVYSFNCGFTSHYWRQNECTCPNPGVNDVPTTTGATSVLCP